MNSQTPSAALRPGKEIFKERAEPIQRPWCINKFVEAEELNEKQCSEVE